MPQQRKTKVISNAPAARILMNAGAKRVSADAADAFSDILYEEAMRIAEKAVIIARHSGRKTINEGDIRIAARK